MRLKLFKKRQNGMNGVDIHHVKVGMWREMMKDFSFLKNNASSRLKIVPSKILIHFLLVIFLMKIIIYD